MSLEIVEYVRYSLICRRCGHSEDGYESEGAVEEEYQRHIENDCKGE